MGKNWVQFRRDLHAHPELSGEERETARRVRRELEKLGADRIEGVAETGILAIFEGETEGPTLLLRSDLDALPIEESNDFAHRSQNPGVSHKCGHDGHTAILLAVAERIQQEPPKRGNVLLLFQPAEEIGKGAQKVLDDPLFAEFEPDEVLALHNLPGYPLHTVVLREGAFTAAVCTLILRFQGRSAHAAEPENGHNPIGPLAKVIAHAEKLQQSDPSKEDFCLFTPVYLHAGEMAYGTAAGEGEVHYTIRAWTTEILKVQVQALYEFAKDLADQEQLQLSKSIEEEFYSNHNHPETVQTLREIVRDLKLPLEEIRHPLRWGEDFGAFTERYPGAMFGLGAGEDGPALHNPDYDFPDALIPTASNIFYHMIQKRLS